VASQKFVSENCAHHFHRVAFEREIVRDDERDEADAR
jgi:hypothetical protein